MDGQSFEHVFQIAPVTEELASMFARAAIGELIDHGAHVGELRCGICLYVCALPFSMRI
ncbi:unnamed protein product (plasmid) [Mycetohabitans rhizoxinica HKI 454]|uniref:Uncharacterized protein n=1 Tax=Mycetohabitans rhizoxinica (strain DSM 19002 / CIP 109453 / HKI 454) TaxID=882378 RepID=E5AUG7_MYCRK|nr:unnamed protein product [Mycetohabitans rhizoxinica HKI 454]